MNLKEISKIISLVEDAKITSLSLEDEGMKIEIKKDYYTGTQPLLTQVSLPQPAGTLQAPNPQITETPEQSVSTGNGKAITSPMVGTFYASPTPDDEPFVKIGDTVKKGQIVCIIEAMKLFNEIESDVSGTVEKVLIETGQAVDYGKELFLIKPE